MGVLIEKFATPYNRCECSSEFILEFWYLLVDGYAIVLSVILTVVGVTYTRKQK